MARESCNLDKEEAEILKPSSPSSSSPSPPPSAAASSPPLFLKPSQELPIHGGERPEAPSADPSVAAVPCDQEGKTPEEEEESHSQTPVRFTNRCSRCRKKVGLTGFRCRCGDLFCCRHRYSDAHDCSFDYKAAGREEISRANPVVRAAKIIKI